MRKLRIVVTIAIALIALALAVRPSPRPVVEVAAPTSTPRPTPRPTPDIPGNLLINPSLEGEYDRQDGISEVMVPEGWRAWFLDEPPCSPRHYPWGCGIPCPDNCLIPSDRCKLNVDDGCWWARPEFAPARLEEFSYRVRSGERAQKYFSFGRMHEGGMYQQVTVTVGSLVRFSIFAQAWMCFDANACADGRISDQPSDMHLRVGIDPYGRADPLSSNIVWSPEQEAFDRWVEFSVQATAQRDIVTVFTHSQPEWLWARTNNDVYLDDAALVIVPRLALKVAAWAPIIEWGYLTE